MRCPNCGKPGFEETKEFECRSCGFHEISNKEYAPIDLVFCEGCGCTLSTYCELHPKTRQKLFR